jgi:hypothetical protein
MLFPQKETQVIIKNWVQEPNTIRTHSSLNDQPSAPKPILPMGHELSLHQAEGYQKENRPI